MDQREQYGKIPRLQRCAEIQPVKRVSVKRGWDLGLTPACVFTQMTPER
jgi:hypothetical protein